MTEYGKRLLDEYRATRPLYEQFTTDISKVVTTLLHDSGIEHLPLEERTKTEESFFEKVERPDKAQKYTSCGDITDLSGIRIIAYLQEDRDKICNIIERTFQVDFGNSTKKEEILNADQFGYGSTHYVISYTSQRLDLPEFQKFTNLKAEVQVRTLLQHTWAAIDWKLRYKTEFDVPKELKRKLYRISALLEVADDNFSELANGVKILREEYRSKLETGSFDIDMNRESIELFVSEDNTIGDIRYLAEGSSYSISPPAPNSRNPYNTLLMTLSELGITHIGKLKDILNTFLSSGGVALKSTFSAWSSAGKPPKLVIDVSGLIRLCVIVTVSKAEAKAVLDHYPFGPELQKAVLLVIDGHAGEILPPS